MATAVISGRVDQELKQRVDQILAREGKTVGDVIRDVWVTIGQTGALPATSKQEEALRGKRESLREFMDLVESLPPAPSWFSAMTDEDMRNLVVDGMLQKDRRLAGGESHVSPTD